MNKRLILPLLLIGLLWQTAVLAHSEILASSPAPGETLSESPSEIRLTFNEAVAPTSSLLLFSGGFQQVDGIQIVNESENPEQIVAVVPALNPGEYTVEWTALSPDGHTVRGSYSFVVLEDTSGTSLWVYIVIGSLLLGAVGILLLRRRQ